MTLPVEAALPRPIPCPPRAEWPALLARPTAADRRELEAQTEAVFAALASEGLPALQRYAAQWDGVGEGPLEVDPALVQQAGRWLDPDLKRAIDQAAEAIERYHSAQLQGPSAAVETRPGVLCWREQRALEVVGLYAPGGATPLISSVLMTGIPARLAGCDTIVLCTPPWPEGATPAPPDDYPAAQPAPAMLYAAKRAGVHRIFRIGGAQAIAAMALGVGMPAVHKLFGPGSARVDSAKQLATRYGVALDLPAGPSELALISDGSLEPAWAAADLLSQAEHGVDSQVLALSWSGQWLERVADELERQVESLPRRDVARQALRYARLIAVRDAQQAFDLVNAYAPEHLILALPDAREQVQRVRHAGAVFLGPFSPESAGDYATGSNHCLPTGGAARAWSGLSLADFQRQMSVQELSREGLQGLGPVITTLARAEGLEAHARAVDIRLNT